MTVTLMLTHAHSHALCTYAHTFDTHSHTLVTCTYVHDINWDAQDTWSNAPLLMS